MPVVPVVVVVVQIAHAGRFYKELICSFNGMQVTVGLLESAKYPHTRLLVYDLFLVLGSGNPKYANKVQSEIISLISTRNIHALRLGIQAIRRLVGSSSHMHIIQTSSRGNAHNMLLQLIDKTIPLLGSPDFEVQVRTNKPAPPTPLSTICPLLSRSFWPFEVLGAKESLLSLAQKQTQE